MAAGVRSAMTSGHLERIVRMSTSLLATGSAAQKLARACRRVIAVMRQVAQGHVYERNGNGCYATHSHLGDPQLAEITAVLHEAEADDQSLEPCGLGSSLLSLGGRRLVAPHE
jgi:hypothetical protein